MEKRLPKPLGIMVVAATVAAPWLVPPANADMLPNGYNVTCTPKGDGQAFCEVSGCPQVRAGEAADTIHVNFNAQPMHEVPFPCNFTSGITTQFLSETVDNSIGFDFFIQGCRKHAWPEKDDCGATSKYHYTPPPKAAPPPAAGKPSPAGTCISGYVWREANPSDHVCVTPGVRGQTAQDNAAAAGRVDPKGASGPNSCKQGFVWRNAYPGDAVCVTINVRNEASADNAAASSRVAH